MSLLGGATADSICCQQGGFCPWGSRGDGLVCVFFVQYHCLRALLPLLTRWTEHIAHQGYSCLNIVHDVTEKG